MNDIANYKISKKTLIIISIFLVFCVYVYSNIKNHQFLINWDDSKYVTQNFDSYGITIKNIKSAFTSMYVGNYAPIQIVDYMMDYDLFGLYAPGYKLHNVFLHFFSCIMFYFFLVRHSQFNRFSASIAALIFLVHPVQVESVAWVSQRKSVLSGFFFLVALFSYGEYRVRSQHRLRWYVFSATAFTVALLSKSIAVVLIPLLILCDKTLWVDKPIGKADRLRWLPFVILGGLCTLAALYTQNPSVGGRGGISDYPGGSPWATLLTMIPVVFRYFTMIFWPVNLGPAYDVTIRSSIDWAVFGGTIFIVALVIGGIILYRRSRQLFPWYAFVFLALLPVSQVVPLVTLMNDRYLYMPLLGVSAVTGKLAGRFYQKSRINGKVVAIVIFGVLVSFSFLARKQVSVWSDSLTLWRHAIAVEPNSFAARVVYAGTLVHFGYDETAESLLRGLLKEYPNHRETMVNLATILCKKGNFREAEPLLQAVTNQYPYFSQGHELLGMVFYQTGRKTEAETSLRNAVRLEKNSIQAKVVLGTILLERRKLPEAEKVLSEAWGNASNRADLAYSLACVFALQGKKNEAITYLKHVEKLGFPNLYIRLVQNQEFNSIRKTAEFNDLLLQSARP